MLLEILLVVFVLSTVALAVWSASVRRAMRRLEQEREHLLADRDRIDEYLEIAGAMIVMLDPTGRIVRLNRKSLEFLGADLDSVVGGDWYELFVPDETRDEIRGRFEGLMSGNQGDEGYAEYAIVNARGEHRHAVWYRRVLRDDHDAVTGLLSAGIDDTERRERELLLTDLAIRDELTGLYNRRGFREVAAQRRRVAAREGHHCYLLYADIDRLKEINDRYGHEAGDAALVVAAEAMRVTFRSGDVLARVGGDEFVVLAPLDSRSAVDSLLGRLGTTLSVGNGDGESNFTFTLSVGAAEIDDSFPDPVGSALCIADREMYERKRAT
jgi:diguanylate cyclase (GGDEF)-like protein/PAS domain S-box-containing protein